jgi:hypothetical protein
MITRNSRLNASEIRPLATLNFRDVSSIKIILLGMASCDSSGCAFNLESLRSIAAEIAATSRRRRVKVLNILSGPQKRTARKLYACGPPGGLFGFDHEVVTLSIP